MEARSLKAALVLFAILSSFALLACGAQHSNSQGTKVFVVDVNDCTIDAGIEEWITRAIEAAERESNACVIIKLNTNGGYLRATQNIVDKILNTNVDVVVYVSPIGARAYSAGAYIGVAAKYLVMHRSTVIGSAGPAFLYPATPEERAKVVNALATWMEAIATERGRNVSACIAMVRNNADYTAEEALEYGVANCVASSELEIYSFLNISSPERIEVQRGLKSSILSVISDPLVLWLLVELGVIALIVDIVHTSVVLTAIGIAMIAMALYGFGVIGVNVLALILLLLGTALIMLELVQPGIQVFGVLGIVSTILGLILLYSGEPLVSPGLHQAVVASLVIVVLALGGFYLYKIREVLAFKRTFHEPKLLVGKRGVVKKKIKPNEPGVVLVASETWSAVADEVIPEGEVVEVISVDGLTLRVRRVREGGGG